MLLGVVAFIFFGRWLPSLIDLLGGDPANADYQENPTAYLLIGFLDLGIVVPAALVAAAGLSQRRPWARTAAYAVIGWFALVPAAVAAMAIVMTVNDDPQASNGATTMFVVAGSVFTAGAALLYRPLFRSTSLQAAVTSQLPRPLIRVEDSVDLRTHHQIGPTLETDRQPISHNGQERS